MELDHLSGYKDSRLVRLGNAANKQLQLDLYGAVLDAAYLYNKHGAPLDYELWQNLQEVLDWLSKNRRQPDEGMWEVRRGQEALRLLKTHVLGGTGAGSDALDASLLLMPLVKFVGRTDLRWLATMERIQAELTHDVLVYRYDIEEAAPDGLEGGEGTFSLCSFWLVECLTQAGRLEEARLTLEKMFSYANHLGLYAEEIGPSGEALGNFPQAFTYLALISATVHLNHALGHG